MALQIFNTLTRRKEMFTPLQRNHVRMYVCGPTVYGHSHLGHAKSYVSFDVIVRYLRSLGYSVLYVQNITDVGHLLGDTDEGEDRLLKQSRVEKKHPMEIAEEYTRSYFEDMDALKVVRPNISPRATGHVVEQIEIIRTLIEKELAYESNGSVYFDVRQFDGYGKLSGRVIDELEAGARVEVKTEKRNAEDFALWKRAEPEHIMRWPSPWSEGFPGWHIECSAMSMKYLGESFDIHGGGLENQFPHHECEIAQSEGATGKPFVKYWVHNNMVTVNGQKMGKSLGNFTTLKDAFVKWDPSVIRFFILQSHYRSTLDFSDAAVDGAGKGLERLMNSFRQVIEHSRLPSKGGAAHGINLNEYKSAFLTAMDDDFNTPKAIGVLFDLSREINSILSANTPVSVEGWREVASLQTQLADDILGILTDEMHATATTNGSIEEELLDLIMEIRRETREQRLWVFSDKIRDGLQKVGIIVEDTKEGPKWKRVD